MNSILLIDDDADDQLFFMDALSEINADVSCEITKNGNEALNRLEKDPLPDIIFLGLNMPVMNGLELRRKIQENSQLRRQSIPFIFLSTAARPKEVEEAYDLTVQGFFVKASQLAEMEKSLELILRYWMDCKHPNSVK